MVVDWVGESIVKKTYAKCNKRVFCNRTPAQGHDMVNKSQHKSFQSIVDCCGLFVRGQRAGVALWIFHGQWRIVEKPRFFCSSEQTTRK